MRATSRHVSCLTSRRSLIYTHINTCASTPCFQHSAFHTRLYLLGLNRSGLGGLRGERIGLRLRLRLSLGGGGLRGALRIDLRELNGRGNRLLVNLFPDE